MFTKGGFAGGNGDLPNSRKGLDGMCTSKRRMASKAALPSQPAVRLTGSLGDKARGQDVRSQGGPHSGECGSLEPGPARHASPSSEGLALGPQTPKGSVDTTQGICDLDREENISHLRYHEHQSAISFHDEGRQQTHGRRDRPSPQPCHRYKSQILAYDLTGVTENFEFLSHRTSVPSWLL